MCLESSLNEALATMLGLDYVSLDSRVNSLFGLVKACSTCGCAPIFQEFSTLHERRKHKFYQRCIQHGCMRFTFHAVGLSRRRRRPVRHCLVIFESNVFLP
jgi:hypothetical protein